VLCLHLSFDSFGDHRDLHSFPIRRSSDLTSWGGSRRAFCESNTRTLWITIGSAVWCARRVASSCSQSCSACSCSRSSSAPCPSRSEEHTSELQSLRHLVCRLLLEKKKKTH